MNYYDVERSFLAWQDSMQQHDRRSFLFRVLHRERMEQEKEFREEAQEYFYHWAAIVK